MPRAGKITRVGAKKFLERPLDKQPITLRGYEGQKEALRLVPNWQERLREVIDKLIDESKLDADFNPRVVLSVLSDLALDLRHGACALAGCFCVNKRSYLRLKQPESQ